MSTSTTCPKCGTLNAQWARFCAKCGNPLTVQPPQQPTASPMSSSPTPTVPPPWYTYTPQADYTFRHQTQIDRTKTGLLLLIIGVLLAPVPYIGVIGSLLSLIGAILVILGRNAFGPKHSRNVIWAIVIYIVGGVIFFIGGIVYAFEVISDARLANGDLSVFSAALTSAFQDLLIAAFIGSIVIGIAHVLFTYAIQNKNGRILLWTAYASSLAFGIISAILVTQSLSTAVQQSVVGGVYDPTPLQNLRNQLQVFGLLGFIPAALWSTALYLVWSRIGRGELPPSTQVGPSYPSFTPPSPPAPSPSPPPPT